MECQKCDVNELFCKLDKNADKNCKTDEDHPKD
jgi:hypothetical protein